MALAALSGSANASAARTTAAATANAATANVAAPASASTGSVSFYQTYGMQQGAVSGPGGPGGAGPQIWLIAMDPPEFQGNPAGSQALDEVSPTTGAVNYWAPLPPYVGNTGTLLAYDDGAPAFDGSGHAWMIATSTTLSGAQSHYLVRYTPGPSSSAIYKLAATCSSPHGITAASDGSVWLACNSAKAIRVTASGAMRTFGLSRVATIVSLAAAKSGVMWAVGENSSHSPIGLVRLTSGGGEAYYATPRGITARGVAGDGSARIIETAACGSTLCFESVSSAGKLAHVGTAPNKVSGSYGPAMDASGNVWLLVRGSWSKTGQYFIRLTSGNKTQSYAFSLPGCGTTLLSIAGHPVGSANGSAWAESVTNCTSIGNAKSAYVGGVVRLEP
ncbi:MAG: hypothetical protein ABSA02_05875 [Trebonia sp.]